VNALCEGLKDPDGQVRVAAADALGALGDVGAVYCLTNVNDPLPEVRQHVAQALALIQIHVSGQLRLVVVADKGVAPETPQRVRDAFRTELARYNMTVGDADAGSPSLHTLEVTIKRNKSLVLVLRDAQGEQIDSPIGMSKDLARPEGLEDLVKPLVARLAASAHW
jgi:HEAT repeat protein